MAQIGKVLDGVPKTHDIPWGFGVSAKERRSHIPKVAGSSPVPPSSISRRIPQNKRMHIATGFPFSSLMKFSISKETGIPSPNIGAGQVQYRPCQFCSNFIFNLTAKLRIPYLVARHEKCNATVIFTKPLKA